MAGMTVETPSALPETMWLVMAACEFDKTLSIVTPAGEVPAKMRGTTCIGYCPLFASREDAEASYPDHTVVTIRRSASVLE